MTTNRHLTSLQKLVAALEEHGYTFAVKEEGAMVRVKDYDNASRDRLSGRARYVPTKLVPGRIVHAGKFTAHFTEDGKYLPEHTSGTYPFRKGASLTDLLANIPKEAPARLKAQQEARIAREEALAAEEAEQVAASYEAAKSARFFAQSAAAKALREIGLTPEQASKVLVMVTEPGNVLQALASAEATVEQASKGYGLGRTALRNVYRDGKPLTEDEIEAEHQKRQRDSIAALGKALAQ